jgi:hypothetical protein
MTASRTVLKGYAHFTCVASTKVQVLTQTFLKWCAVVLLLFWCKSTSLTSTKVQILTELVEQLMKRKRVKRTAGARADMEAVSLSTCFTRTTVILALMRR